MREQRLDDRYRLTKRIFEGHSARGVPELWQAQDAGDSYFVKLWKRSEVDADDIRALWNREVRSLSRLQGYPGASELFVRLHDLGLNEKHFYVVLDGGRRVVLSNVIQNRARHNWLLNLSEVARRRPIWEGLLRIAEAVSILHGEGTLHRSLSSAAVFTGPDGAADFRLSGFEWSLRIASPDGAATKVRHGYTIRAPELQRPDAEYSMATDWFDFGLLAAEILGAPVRHSKNAEGIRAAISKSSQMREGERDALLHFLADNPDERISSAEAATLLIRNITRELNTATAGGSRNLIVAVRLGHGVEMSKTIEIVSNGEAPASDPIKQRQWMEKDLRGDIRVVARNAPVPTFVLKGEKLEYRVREWDVDGLRTWDIGYCESLEPLPRTTAEDNIFGIGLRRLEILLYPHVRKSKQTVRDRGANWDKVFPFRKKRTQVPSHLRNVHDFFRVTQQLDTILTAAQICPVQLVSVQKFPSETEISLTPRLEKERDDLAQYLKLSSPAEQIRDWFDLGVEEMSEDDEGGPKKDRYQLLDRMTVTSNSTVSTLWRFAGAVQHKSGPIYRFRCQGNVPARVGSFYLAKNYGGTITQIRRRHKAIEDMRTHEDLLRLLSNPAGVSRTNADKLPPPRVDLPLDASKQAVLEKIWTTQPSFMVQGPPGTGKTTLIQAFVDRLFSSDPTAQVLITAHSHHTVDDVRLKLQKIAETLKEEERPIMVRVGARDPTEHDIPAVTLDMLERLKNSKLFDGGPTFLKDRIASSLESSSIRTKTADDDLRTMQLLVQEAANITLSTSNAPDLEDLADRGRRFDWSIIEEAGKAHGFDMAAALQASHRLLLIGDHFQLPPYNARLYKDLLGDPLRVRKAIQAGVRFAPGLVDPSLVDDQDDGDSFQERCDSWRRMVDLFAILFRMSAESDRQDKHPAATLTEQHRMHPDIADVVGKIFYPDDEEGTILKSPEETYEKFGKPPPFELIPGTLLPPQRLVWRNVKWIQKEEFSEGEADGLFCSQVEARAVVEILEQFIPRSGSACEVQILSPYNDQLIAIRDEIERSKRRGQLSNMFRDPFDLRKGKRLGATVDEFQGSEADIVIVSLVRNNALVPWKSIGFLKEANRMNVLLSRAKHKLVVVGSWDFFEKRCDENTPPDAEYAYIGKMMSVMGKAKIAKKLARIPGDT
jgi:hypothetical protein